MASTLQHKAPHQLPHHLTLNTAFFRILVIFPHCKINHLRAIHGAPFCLRTRRSGVRITPGALKINNLQSAAKNHHTTTTPLLRSRVCLQPSAKSGNPWLEVSLSEPASDEITERRHAFYAGAIAVMGMFLDIKDPAEAVQHIKSIRRELEEHTMSLLRPR